MVQRGNLQSHLEIDEEKKVGGALGDPGLVCVCVWGGVLGDQDWWGWVGGRGTLVIRIGVGGGGGPLVI